MANLNDPFSGPELRPLTPRCAVHGPMRYEAAGDWWLCHGWDGEGCCALGAEMVGGLGLTVVRPEGEPSRHGYRLAVTVSA
jgi:hypothetical protein